MHLSGRRIAQLIWVVSLLRPCGAAQKQIVSGSLERVTHGAITVRQADGILIDARLPGAALRADALAARYKLGDRVEITCKPILFVFDEESRLYLSLELEKLRFLGAPSPDQLAGALTSRAWRDPGNLLKPATGEPTDRPAGTEQNFDGSAEARQSLEHTREIALRYVARLPNFIADETATRYTARTSPPEWRLLDTIQSEVKFRGAFETRDQVLQNGKLLKAGMKALGGLRWAAATGSALKPLFDPVCPVSFEFAERRTERGRELLVYDFSSPPDSCFGATTSSYQRYYAGWKGKVFIDESTGNVLQLDWASTGFPAAFGFVEAKNETIWDYVKIGDASHLLPVSSDDMVHYSAGQLESVKVQYTNHREFEAASTITFH
jgi:hypothetical protein